MNKTPVTKPIVNIKASLKKLISFCSFFITALGLIFILMMVGTFFFIWVSSGFSPYAFAIDSCLDHGGTWHYVADECAYTDEEEQALIEQYDPKRPN